MIVGLSGSLLSHEALERSLADVLRGRLDQAGRCSAYTRIRRWHLPLRAQLGPTASARVCFDRLAAPLFSQLGYRVIPCDGVHGHFSAVLQSVDRRLAVVTVTAWGTDPGGVWRDAVRLGISHDVRWAFCLVGPVLRIFDSRRTYSRRHVQFSLQETFDDERAFDVFWGLLRATAMHPVGEDHRPLLDRAVELTEQHRAAVRGSLQEGVHQSLDHLIRAFTTALTRRRLACGRHAAAPTSQRAFDESLTVIYRILFLLFAEARGLVPRWHPVYRDAYTIEALRRPVELLPRPRGLWETLQAISRLAHRGCQVGALRVPPFNGRLFSPVESPLADRVPLDDGEVRQAVLALTTRPGSSGRVSIAYGDLGVEQLGSIYERLLDFEAAPLVSSGSRAPLRRAERRKITGSFYTPRSVTDYLVRRALGPLVHDATPERILALRVLDPAMGSGAFLVAACRFLADAYESALLREGTLSLEDITEHERIQFRRAVAQQCLYGVDINPMAVQVGRLSIWLATLAADRPLTFLDHHLRVGNSLAGAFLTDLARSPSPRATRAPRDAPLPLFDDIRGSGAIRKAVGVRAAIAASPDDTLDQVRSKERALAALHDSSASRWKQVADLWCSAWFTDPCTRDVLSKTFATVSDAILGRACSLSPATVDPILQKVALAAGRERFFHWSLEFPEAFFDIDGEPLSTAGFDAIIGNPPWEMLRGDRGDEGTRAAARSAGGQLTAFARRSGAYTLQGDGHANLYQLFLERSLALLATGGRLGLVLPSGFATDQGSAPLRRGLLDRVVVDWLISVENRDGLFPVHRGLKFLLLSASKSSATTAVPCRFGVRSPEALDALPDSGVDRHTIVLPRPLLERVSGPCLAVPEFRSDIDVQIVSSIAFSVPAVGDPEGWHVRFGRELNATEDRQHFEPADGVGLLVLEGKHLLPFALDLTGVRHRISRKVAARLVDPARTFRRARLAYRDVAASSNRLSLIAAIVPKECVTTHTIFCLRDDPGGEVQQYLCGIFNSFVANYLVRLRITTHVSVAVIDRLPVPKPEQSDRRFREVATLAGRLAAGPRDSRGHARLQALAAELYGLNREQFAHVLSTFPLVASTDRAAAMSAFCDIVV